MLASLTTVAVVVVLIAAVASIGLHARLRFGPAPDDDRDDPVPDVDE